MLKVIFSWLFSLSVAFGVTLDWSTVQQLARQHGAEQQRIERDYRIGIINSTLDRRSYWPKIEASSTYPSQTESLREQLFYNSTDSTYLSQWVRDRDRRTSLGLTVSQELPLGFQVNANGTEWKRKYSVGGESENSEYGVSYQTDLRWKLLSGDPTGRSYRNAGQQRIQIEEQRKVKEREFELSLISDYIGFMNTDGQLKLTINDATIADSSRALAKRKFDAGLIPQTEYLTIEVSALGRMMAAASATRNFEAVREKFLDRLGLAPNIEIEIPTDPKLPQFDTNAVFKVDPAKLPETRIARLEYEQAKRTSNGSLFPLPLQIEGTLFQNWDGRDADRPSALDKLSASKGGALSLTLGLLDRNEYLLRLEKVRLNLREQELSYRDAVRDAERTVRDAFRKLADARERLVSAEKLLQLSRLRESMTASRFQAGTVSSREWLEAQQDRLSSEQQWLTARGDWIVAALRMQRLQEQCE